MWSDYKIESRKIDWGNVKIVSAKDQHDKYNQSDLATLAARVYHHLYPKSNFYMKRYDFQREFINTVGQLYAIGNSRDLREGRSGEG